MKKLGPPDPNARNQRPLTRFHVWHSATAPLSPPPGGSPLPQRAAPSSRRTPTAYAKIGRPRGQSLRAPQNPPLTPRSSSATSLAIRSPRRVAGGRGGPSMRPRESEGTAAGCDEDDEGAVRSERSGPQSLARRAHPPPAAGAPRRPPPPTPPRATHEAPPPPRSRRKKRAPFAVAPKFPFAGNKTFKRITRPDKPSAPDH